ncbi:MAG: hypothetical protein ABIN67_19705 [Ferruginibacter sp.]
MPKAGAGHQYIGFGSASAVVPADELVFDFCFYLVLINHFWPLVAGGRFQMSHHGQAKPLAVAQYRQHGVDVDRNKNIEMKKLVILFIVLSISTYSLYSQNKTIKGRVIDNHQLGNLGYVAIVTNDTVEVGRTDISGFFQIDIPISMNKLLFRSVGIEQAIIILGNNCDEVEIIMMLSSTYDFITLKKVDRLRKKEFKKLPELHKEAFEKGIFKSDNVCYTQQFIPYYNKQGK